VIHQVLRLRPKQVATDVSIGVAEASTETSVPDRLLRLLPTDRVPANTPLVLLWQGAALSSADTLEVTGASRRDRRIDLYIELRRFTGTVHANVITVPVVEVRLGVLKPGRYEVSVEETEFYFTDHDHPERGLDPVARRAGFSFLVV
jgi:hypothetical protein